MGYIKISIENLTASLADSDLLEDFMNGEAPMESKVVIEDVYFYEIDGYVTQKEFNDRESELEEEISDWENKVDALEEEVQDWESIDGTQDGERKMEILRALGKSMSMEELEAIAKQHNHGQMEFVHITGIH